MKKLIDITLADGNFLADFFTAETDEQLKEAIREYTEKAEKRFNSVAVKIEVEDC